MKTAISLPDRVFQEAERTAKRLNVSRSELYRIALEAFLASNRDETIKASYEAAFATEESADGVAFRRLAARKLLAGVEWQA